MRAAGILDFLSLLAWLDGHPLLDTVEPYRRRLFEGAFSVGPDGSPRYSLVLSGRGKKNGKTLDLVLAALYSLLAREAVQGSGGYILANDLDQAGDDLDLAKRLIRANRPLDAEVTIKAREIERRDGRGTLVILPARDVAGSHGKTAAFIGFDEIHEYRDYSLLEALSPDPTRRDVLTWITSYDSLFHVPGRPLFDLLQRGKAGEDYRMLFSWYSGPYTTDPDLAGEEVTPEQRANPSMGTWTNPHYLDEQRRRLPSNKYRRLHLNVGGQPEGAYFSAERIVAAVVEGRRRAKRDDGIRYSAFVDMSGGSSDDAVLAVGHRAPDGRAVLDLIEKQAGPAPFNPRQAVEKFASLLKEWDVSAVTGDAYAGQTFRRDFEERGVTYHVSNKSTSDLYEDLEPKLNAGEVELLDVPVLVEQLSGLIVRGGKVTHPPGDHDDFATAAAGVVDLVFAAKQRGPAMFDPFTGAPIEADGRRWRQWAI